MDQVKIALVVGSLRYASLNMKLAHSLLQIAPANFILNQLTIGDLPLYNQDDDEEPSHQVQRFKSEIMQADGLIFITPEYNRSVPGVLKNAIDHASRPHGKSVWRGKPAALLGVSIGAVGTAVAQQHLRTILAYLDVLVMGQPEVYIHDTSNLFDDEGHLAESHRPLLKSWMDHYARWVKLQTQH